MSNLTETPTPQGLDDPEPKCKLCNDLGYIITVVDGIEYFKECTCRELEKAEKRLKASGISDEFLKKGFKNFDDRNMPLLQKAKNIALDYCKRFDEIKNTRNNSIMFMGQVGSGKTHLSMAVCNAIMEHYKTAVLYMPYREAITKIKQTIGDEINYQREMSRYKNVSVLMIDDLLKGKSTEADVNILFDIINYRYINNKPMIISTEKLLNELLDFDEGIMSRVAEMAKGHWIEITGREYNYRIYA